jgi:hypothetical protein
MYVCMYVGHLSEQLVVVVIEGLLSRRVPETYIVRMCMCMCMCVSVCRCKS